jgi:hypothetical protein
VIIKDDYNEGVVVDENATFKNNTVFGKGSTKMSRDLFALRIAMISFVLFLESNF